MKSYAIIGTGAIGGYCAMKLQQANFDVHCLLNSDYLLVKRHGLTLITNQEKITLQVNAYNTIQQMPTCDVIVIALKTTATSQVKQLSENFQKAGFNTIISTHLPTTRWKKLVANIPPGLAIVLNASMQDLVQNPISYQLLLAIAQEIIATAIQCGADIPEDLYQYRVNILKSFKTKPIEYSIQNDFNAKRPLELHAIYENAINIAKQHNIRMPLTEMLYQQLVYLDANNFKTQ